MGTPEQRAHRQAYAANLDKAWNAAIHGQWTTDEQLDQYLQSIGQKSHGPMYNQLYSGGGYSTYGPAWDPGRNFDFEHHQNIPWMSPGQTWYDPSVASNWQNTDPVQDARMAGYFKYRDQNMSDGQNIATYLQRRAASSQPNSPDLSWFTEGGPAARPQAGRTLGTLAPTRTAAPTTATSTSTTAYPPGGFWNSWTQWPATP